MRALACWLFPVLVGLLWGHLAGAQSLTQGWKLARVPDVPQNGSQISQTSFNAAAWVDAVVPGTVLTSYEAAGVIADPYYSTNMQQYSLSGYYDTYYWYRNAFPVPANYAGRKIWLNFDGIHWKAEVYVNGAYVGLIKGPFTRSRFDVTSMVTPGATNAVAVQIYWANATVWDTPTFIGAGGWDFTPTVAGRDIGIYENVYLSASGSVSIVDPFIKTALPLPATSPASLTLQVGLTNTSGSSVSGILSGSISPDGVEFQTNVTVGAASFTNLTLSPAVFSQLSVTNPALWWPNGYGPQNLHNLQLSFQTGGNDSDVQSVSFGIRQYTYNTNGVELQVSCNGQRIMCKGGNWGMPDAMLKYTPEQLDTAVRLHKEMNFTMIRCWHGTSDLKAFYDACDKYGIMVWDDFWLNGSNFGLYPSDPATFIANSIDKYKRLRNRACLAVWCGQNEATTPPSLMLWPNYTNYDNTRIYVDASNELPVHGGNFLYQAMAPDFYFNNAYGFTTEIGSPCVPNLESMQAMMPASSLWPPGNADWTFHNWQFAAANIDGYTNRMAASYGPLTDITNFCEKAQLLNYETFRAIFEAWNGQMWSTPAHSPCSGLLLWMSHQGWPSIIWQTYDWNFDLTGAYFGSKKGCEPQHIQWNINDNSVRVVNATTQALANVSAEIQVYNLDGSLQFNTNLSGLNLSADSVTNCFSLFSDGGNLALNRPAYASSTEAGNNVISNAVDGNVSTRWSSTYNDPQWYYVDLGAPKAFDQVNILWEGAYAQSFQIQVSDNASTWTTVWSTNGMSLGGGAGWSASVFTPVTARYVRMYGTQRATIWGYSMFEFQVLSGGLGWLDDLSSVHFIKLRLKDGSQKLLSENFYWRGSNYDYTALNSLPAVNPTCFVNSSTTNGITTIAAALTNATPNVAFAAVLKLLNQTTGERVLPAIYSDNYFSLMPGEAKTVTIELPNNDSSSGPLRLMLDGWNIPAQQVHTVTFRPAVPTLGTAAALPSGTIGQWTPVNLVCSNWTGTPPYSFQWQMSSTGGNYTDVPGATNTVLSLPHATLADSGYYRLILTANGQSVTSSVAPLTVLPGAGGATGPRLSIKFAADLNWGYDAINSGSPAGVLETKQWYNFSQGTGSGSVNVPFYSMNGVTYPSGTKLIYSYPYKYNTINQQVTQPNNISLVDSYISMNDGWYLSVTNLDPVFTNGYRLYFYYLGIATNNVGGRNTIRYHSGLTTNTPVLGTRQWNMYTTTTHRDQSFVQDLTPSNTSTGGETPGANYFVITNLSGGAFDLLITNSFYGGVSAVEVVANEAASGCTLTVSATNVPYGTPVTFTNRVVPMPANGENIAFLDGDTILGTGTLNGGVATFTPSALSIGSRSITAIYGGNAGYLASTSSIVAVTVTDIPPFSIDVQRLGGQFVLSWPQGVLLQSTNVTGPWTTNGASSPYTNQPNGPQMFYRVRVQ